MTNAEIKQLEAEVAQMRFNNGLISTQAQEQETSNRIYQMKPNQPKYFRIGPWMAIKIRGPIRSKTQWIKRTGQGSGWLFGFVLNGYSIDVLRNQKVK
jgi:hypothetical protein